MSNFGIAKDVAQVSVETPKVRNDIRFPEVKYPKVTHIPITPSQRLGAPQTPLATNPYSPQRPLPYYSHIEYALWPRDDEELYDEARQKYIDSLDQKHEVIQFIESELDKEEPLLLPEPYTPLELDQLHSNYKDTISNIANCSQTFCPGLQQHFDRSLRLALEIDSPEHMYKYRKCRFDRILTLMNPNTCQEALNNVIDDISPRVIKSIEKETMLLTGEKLDDYIGLSYDAPFWFTGAGDVWRRFQHNSTLIQDKQNPCEMLKTSTAKCLADKNKTEDDCYFEYTQSTICDPGIHCRYLRVPMVNCLAANPFTNYNGVTQCLEMLPNFQTCQVEFTPPPQKIHVDVTDMIDKYEMPNFKKALDEFLLDSRRKKYDKMHSLITDRARELIDVDTYPNDNFSHAEMAFLLKHKHIPFDECKRRLVELDIKNEMVNPYDQYLFSDEVALQPSLIDDQHQSDLFNEQVDLFRRFASDVTQAREGLSERVQEQLKMLNWIREETKKRQKPNNEYPDLKNVIYFDNYWKMYFSYQPILNTSYPIFPISHLYHYQDFDYDWVDPNGTLSSVPFIRLDRVGENYSPSFFARELLKKYPKERLQSCRNDPECDNSHKTLGTYLGFPQLDDMNFLNHYRMYFKERDMYLTCYANDTSCIPSRFPDDNYGTFHDKEGKRNWFYRPDKFEYYSYTQDGDRIVYSIADKTVLRYTMSGFIEQVDKNQTDAVVKLMADQAKIWEIEAIDIVKHRTKKETILKGHVIHGGSLLSEHLTNTQFDERIPYTFHPFAKYSDNLDAYRYYLGLKQKEQRDNDISLASDPSLEVKDRIRYRYRRSFDFYNPITTLEDDDANKLRDALILSFHELKLLRHPLGAIIMREMPPRVADRYDSDIERRPTLYNYLNVLKLDPNAAVMFDISEDSPLVINYMRRHNLSSFDQYQEVIQYAQSFQEELINEFQMLEVNEMTKYQEFLAERAKNASNLKLTYTEKLVRLFKLYEKYGQLAPNLEMYCSPFGWAPEGVHFATEEVYTPKNIQDPTDFFTFGV
jgi:hypothetical protein